MFDNIGGKIKALAKGVFILEIIATLILAICVAIFSYDLGFLWFLLVMAVGVVLAYLSVIMLYAFGELVENSTKIAQNVEKLSDSKVHTSNEKDVIKKDSSPNYDLFRSPSKGDFWTCPNCGKSNHKTAGTCGCGYRKTY